MPVIIKNGNEFDAIYDLNREYWNHVDRQINAGNNERIIGALGAAFSLFSGTVSLMSGALKNVNSESGNNIKVTINNYSKYTISIYNMVSAGKVNVPQFIINPGKKGLVDLVNPNITDDVGPEFRIILDNGKHSSNCYIELRRMQKMYSPLGMTRIKRVQIDNQGFHNEGYPSDGGSSADNMINPVFYCLHESLMKLNYMITSGPVSNSSSEIDINILSLS